MKRYPKRPYLISGYRYGQLCLVIPLCLFLIFCKGCGIIGSFLVFGFWFWYSIQSSKQEWERECDKGIASVHCSKDYLESQGFREHHGSHTEEIQKVIITQEMINQYKKEIEDKKKKLEEMIIDQHNYEEIERRWEWHCHKVKNDKHIEEEMEDIYYQIKNKTFKYMNDKAYNEFYKFIEPYGKDDNKPNLYSADLYLFILIREMNIEQSRLYREIMKSYGEDFAVLSCKAYEKIMKGEDLYDYEQNLSL